MHFEFLKVFMGAINSIINFFDGFVIHTKMSLSLVYARGVRYLTKKHDVRVILGP
jgi:hypothetical protein